MNEQPRLNIPELTVSELSAALKKTVEDAYGYVRVRGEISGYRGAHSSGHCYFALKDENAKIEAVVWRREFARLRIKPEEGLEVIVTGRLTTYPGQSKYQIVVETLEPAGVGALLALVEERRKRLAAEGLFDPARKLPPPDHRVDLGGLVLEREIAMAGGVRPAKSGDFAADADVAIGVLHRSLQGGGQFRDGEFRGVDQVFRCGHRD